MNMIATTFNSTTNKHILFKVFITILQQQGEPPRNHADAAKWSNWAHPLVALTIPNKHVYAPREHYRTNGPQVRRCRLVMTARTQCQQCCCVDELVMGSFHPSL